MIKGCENVNLGVVFTLDLASIKDLLLTSKVKRAVMSIGGIVSNK